MDSSPKIPRLSHLQFLVLGIVQPGALSGRAIRDRLRAFGARKSGPAFYQLMARLEDGGFVEGNYHKQVIESQIIRERHYRITGIGSSAWSNSRDFYLSAIQDFGSAERLSGA